MQRKVKLAKLILVESESLKEITKKLMTPANMESALALAEQITNDAKELAKIVEEESA